MLCAGSIDPGRGCGHSTRFQPLIVDFDAGKPNVQETQVDVHAQDLSPHR
jgi:hypothetical protein